LTKTKKQKIHTQNFVPHGSQADTKQQQDSRLKLPSHDNQ